jgi:hypothetical protein
MAVPQNNKNNCQPDLWAHPVPSDRANCGYASLPGLCAHGLLVLEQEAQWEKNGHGIQQLKEGLKEVFYALTYIAPLFKQPRDGK